MIFNFILGLLAGYLVPVVEPMVKQFMEKIALESVELDPNEFDMLALIVLLLAALALVLLFRFESNAFMLVFGAGIGLFLKRLIALFSARG
ncbi:MAG: hypothetical protein AAGD04_12640 [Pseudomonadota bacterium]